MQQRASKASNSFYEFLMHKIEHIYVTGAQPPNLHDKISLRLAKQGPPVKSPLLSLSQTGDFQGTGCFTQFGKVKTKRNSTQVECKSFTAISSAPFIISPSTPKGMKKYHSTFTTGSRNNLFLNNSYSRNVESTPKKL